MYGIKKIKLKLLFLLMLICALVFTGCNYGNINTSPSATIDASPDTSPDASPDDETEPDTTPDSDSSLDTGGKLEIHFIDVGKGECTLVVTPDGKTMLVDGGLAEASQDVISFIRNRGILKIDVIIASHPHDDRIGGLSEVVDNFAVGKIFMPSIGNDTKGFDSLLSILSKYSLTLETAKSGVNVPLGEKVTVDILGPISKAYEHLNDYSAVVKLVFGNTGLLLTGDIEKPSEDQLVANYSNILPSSILKVSNNGSSLSTSAAFLQAVSPKYSVIFTSQDLNPSEAFIDKLIKADSDIYMTGECGTISFFSDGEEIVVKSEKDSSD